MGGAEERMDAGSGDRAQSDGFGPRFKESRAEHYVLANSNPSYASKDVVLE